MIVETASSGWSCWQDEDYIGKCSRITLRTPISNGSTIFCSIAHEIQEAALPAPAQLRALTSGVQSSPPAPKVIDPTLAGLGAWVDWQ